MVGKCFLLLFHFVLPFPFFAGGGGAGGRLWGGKLHVFNLVHSCGQENLSTFRIPLRYLDHEHYRHCVPSNFSSGLATLPLDHVWVDGKENTSWPTNKRLPTGEMLDGKRAYAMIMPYFTTNEMEPDKVNELGRKQLNKLYPQVSKPNFLL